MRRPLILLGLASFVIAGCTRETGDGAAASRHREQATHDAAAGVESAVREVTIPSGTELLVVLDTAIASDSSRVEQPVTAHLSRPVLVEGQTVLPEGSTLSGVVTEVTRAAKVKGRAHIAVRFHAVMPRGTDDRYAVTTASIGRTAAAEKKKDALTIGAPAAGGAIIGGIVGGAKGAAIGAAAGGGAGTAVVLSTRGQEVRLPAGSTLRVRVTEPFTIKMQG